MLERIIPSRPLAAFSTAATWTTPSSPTAIFPPATFARRTSIVPRRFSAVLCSVAMSMAFSGTRFPARRGGMTLAVRARFAAARGGLGRTRRRDLFAKLRKYFL
jgi:hypothetical protein